MRVQVSAVLGLCMALAACGSGSGSGQVGAMASAPAGARATDYSIPPRDVRIDQAAKLPSGVARSAIRIGNDGCYYYVAGAVMAPLLSNAGAQVCK